MKSTIALLVLAFASVYLLPQSAEAQSVGRYDIVTAGKSGQETGYGSIGEAKIGENGKIDVTLTNYLVGSPVTYSGKLGGDVTELSGPQNTSVKIRIIYSNSKAVYGSYTAFRGQRQVGGGFYSMTRR